MSPLPGVKIIQGNDNLGGVPVSNDGVSGLVITGTAPGAYTLGDILTFFSLADAEAAGFDEANDTTNSELVWKHIKDFYALAGTGAELWFMMVANTELIQDLVDITKPSNAKALLVGANGRIKMLGVAVNPEGGYTPTFVDGLDDNVALAVTNAQALVVEEQAEFRWLSIVVEGRGYQGDSATVKDFRTLVADRVSVVIAADKETTETAGLENAAALMVAIGRLAFYQVHINLGKVKNGLLPGNWKLSGNSPLDTLTNTELGILNDKGFIFAHQPSGLGGYVFNDDPTSSSLLLDYPSIVRGRVMDKASFVTWQVYLNEVNTEVPVDPNTGQVDPAFLKDFQAKAQDGLDLTLVADNEVSGARALVDPAQDVITTNKIAVQVFIVPVGYAKEIEVTLNFSTTLPETIQS